jgi:hypothetical protein
MFLSESSASCASGVHVKWSDSFISLYSGRLRSPSRAMKRLRAATQLVTHCTPFRFLIGPMFIISEIFSGLASMPRSDMTKPRSMPLRSPKTHFSGFNFIPCCRSFAKTSVRSGTRSPVFFDLTTMSSTYASMMRPINSPKTHHMHRWKSSAHIFEPKGHRLIALRAKRSNE